jgi:uncharacterized membrane protein YjjP (DUF1212 family)
MTATAVTDTPRAGPAVTEFLLRFGQAGHAAGYSTAELEERLELLAEALGIPEIEVSATPTILELSVGPLSRQQTYTLRVVPAPVDLGAIARLDDLMRDVLGRSPDADEALAALEALQRTPHERSLLVTTAAYGAAGFALAPMVGGGWREAVAAAIVGALLGLLAVPARRRGTVEPALAPVVAMTASFSAAVLASIGLGAAPDVTALAALVTFLPGMTLTVGVRELAGEHLQSGVANVANALVQLLGLVFGVEIGRSVAEAWLGPSAETAPHAPVTAAQALAAVLAGVAFTGTLRARLRDAPVIVCATVLAVAANAVGKSVLGAQAGVFGAALAVGLAGAVVGSRLRRSPLVFIVPGVLMLVPGSIGFNSALQLLAHQTISGMTAGFDTFVTAVSIAYGLMIATLLTSRGLTQARARDQSRVAAPAASPPADRRS